MSAAIVVGGGILGMATAWRLAQAGMRVTLVEAGGLASGASRATFGWLTSSSAIEPSATYPAPYRQLKVDGIAEYSRIARELDDASWLHLTGHTEWDMADGGPDRIRRKVADLESWQYPAELLPAHHLADLEPDLAPPPGLEAFIYYPHEGYIDPGAFVGAVARRVRSLGVTVRSGTGPVRLLPEGSRIAGVALPDGPELRADVVVTCAGIGTPALLRQVGVELPMTHSVGMVAVSGPSAARLRGVHHNEGMSIRPDGGGRVMMRHWDFDAMVAADTPTEPHPPCVGDLLARVQRSLPALAGTPVEAVRIAVRPIPADDLPVVGPVPGVEGLYAMVGHGVVTHGPLVARLAATEIARNVQQATLAPYRPDRLVTATAPA